VDDLLVLHCCDVGFLYGYYAVDGALEWTRD
jgi:hypothetical protein